MTTTHDFRYLTTISDSIVSVGDRSRYAYNFVEYERGAEVIKSEIRQELVNAAELGVKIVLVHTGSSQYNEDKIEVVLALIRELGMKMAMTTCCTPGGCYAGRKFLLCEKWEIPYLREALSPEDIEVVVEKYAARKDEDKRRGYLHVEYEREFFQALAELEGVVQDHLLYRIKRGTASFIAGQMTKKQPELTEQD